MNADMIDRQQQFALGVCYYPEHWPRDRWEHYANQMRDLGLTYVRIAEFSWSRIEPEYQHWNWSWLDEAIGVLESAGLKVVLCTPTAAPPAWLIQAHPEILPVDVEGHVRNFGGRRHYDFASVIYREHSRRITRAIAERYGQHPAVVGWQTDNEFGDHDTGRSYSSASRDSFRVWLGERYPSLTELNNSWGTVFWSQEYTDWDQINPPNLTAADPNPSHVLDYYRFCSDMVIRFQEEQVAILRLLSPGRWITHNYMRFTPDFDHYRASECLDFASWDSYPTGAVAYSDMSDDDKARFARIGHPDLTGFQHDLYRGMTRTNTFWVMEQQAGQINWTSSNPLPATGAVKLWTAHAWAHGASVVSYFRWRTTTMAQEILHSGLLRHDETLDRGGHEIENLKSLELPNSSVTPSVVLLHDYENLWIYDEQPHNDRATYWGQVMLFYTALRSLGIDVDIRHPDSDLSSYKLIVAPALQMVGERRARHLTSYASSARLVFGPRTGFRTMSGQAHESGQPGPLQDLLGCKMLNFDSLPAGLDVHVEDHAVEIWAESYRLTGGELLFEYADGPLTSQAAAVQYSSVTTVGAWSSSLIAELLTRTLGDLDIPAIRLPTGVRVSRRGAYEVLMNFNKHSVTLEDGTNLDPISYSIRY